MKYAILFLLTAMITATSPIPKPALSVTITADKTSYKIGEIPKLIVSIRNESDKDVYLIGALDGSDMQWRYPYCYFTIEKPKPDTIVFGRCGNTNPLRIEDFRPVKAGEKFDPFMQWDQYGFFSDHTTSQPETFRNPGIYKIQFHYSTNEYTIGGFMGNFRQWGKDTDSMKVKSLFEKVPKINILSNQIELNFEE